MVLQRLVEVGSDGMHNVHQPVNSGPRCYTVRAPSHHHNSTTITRRYTTTTSHFATTNHTTSSPDPSYTSLNPLHDLTTSLSHLTDKDDAPSITSLPPPPPTLGARRGVDPSYSDELNPAGSRAAHGQSDSHGQGHLSPSIIDRVAAADQSGHGQDTGDRRASLPSTSPFITHPNNSTPHAAVHIPAGARPLDTYLQPLLGQPLFDGAVRLRVIADGRCPVASVLLALGSLPDDHCNDKGRNAIDQARRALGHSMTTGWTEQQWVDTVPIELRGANIQRAKGRSQVTQSSFRHYHQLLTQASPTTWLDHCVFYLVSRSFSVAVLIVQVELREDKWQQPIHTISCRHIGAEHERHIVIVHTLQRRSGHYECVQHGGQRVFPSRHPLVERLVEMAHSHAPAAAPEVDVEKTQQEAFSTSEVIDLASDDTPVRTEKRSERTKQVTKGNPTAPPTPARRAPSRRLRHIKKQDTSQSSQSSATFPPQHLSTTSHTAQGSSPSQATSTLPVAGPLPSVADIAAHGQLYDFVSFTNVPQWVGTCNLVFNQYRIASQDGNCEAQTQALVDLLMLPQRVLPRRRGEVRAIMGD
jgi:hypothetical protein